MTNYDQHNGSWVGNMTDYSYTPADGMYNSYFSYPHDPKNAYASDYHIKPDVFIDWMNKTQIVKKTEGDSDKEQPLKFNYEF
jgi:hypothetical protein